MPTLLLTRSQPQSDAFAAALEAALPGRYTPVVCPLVAIRPLAPPLDLSGIAALAFTSANGVAAFAALSPERGLPAFCVGDATAAAASAAGLSARSAAGDAAALAALIAGARPGPVLHLRGTHAAADLTALLAARGVPARALVLYDQRPSPPTPEAAALLAAGGIDAVALFSPRSAGRFAELAAAKGWDLGRCTSVAISPAADAALDRLPPGRRPQRRLTAAAPSRAAMIAALAGA